MSSDTTDATDTSPMPEAPWWSQPGTTSVQSPPTSAGSPEIPPRTPRRAGTAGLLALALLAGGGGGALAATALDNGGSTSGSTVSRTIVVGSAGKTIRGTPESAAALIGPSVVTVEVTGVTSNQFGAAASQTDTGSGISIRSAGYILTNNHVVAAAAGGNGAVHVTLNDGKTVSAEIVGTDSSIDLAVLHVTGVNGLQAATFADSTQLRVGQAVLAVGAPLGLANTVTQGIVSTLHRPVRTGDSSSSQAVIDAVQTDAAINPGNSGGALVDLAGRVVGVNSAIATTGRSSGGQAGNIGVGFAIPSDAAVKVADQLIATGKASHAQMGVSVAEAPNSTDGAPGLGAAIQAVTPGGPAQKAGVRSGDVVTKVDDRRVTDADSLIVAIRSHDPGSTVTLTLTRAGHSQTLRVTLAGVRS